MVLRPNNTQGVPCISKSNISTGFARLPSNNIFNFSQTWGSGTKGAKPNNIEIIINVTKGILSNHFIFSFLQLILFNKSLYLCRSSGRSRSCIIPNFLCAQDKSFRDVIVCDKTLSVPHEISVNNSRENFFKPNKT